MSSATGVFSIASSDESDRQTILQLLVEERQKQKDAGDAFIR
jgi:hypothetical protein